MYHLILVIAVELLRENDSLVRPQRIFSLNPHRLPLLQREGEKKTHLLTHMQRRVFATTDRLLINMLLTSQSRPLREPVVSFFFFILHPGWDDCQSGQSPAEQVISKYTHTVTRTHTNTCTHNRQMLSGLNLLPHPDLLVHFGGGRPNSSKT